MAALDDLLARITDDALRVDLEREIKPLRGERELGLVFERHMPERVRLPGQKVRRGSTVEIQSDSNSAVWQVVKILGSEADLRRRNGDGATVTETLPVDDLVVVREFGQPIYPGLRSVLKVEQGGDKPFHSVINAENYHALETLQYTHQGQVDLVLIDPPYNTGARDWKYNNDYVDDNDSYRHSKWLSFMEKRLQLAKKLLRPDGILIVTIDEYEANNLGLLLKELFPSNLHYSVSIVINSRGSTGTRNFGVIDEKALFVVPDLGHDIISSRESFPGLLSEAKAKHSPELDDIDENAVGVDDLDASDIEDEGVVVADETGAYWTTAYRTGAGTSYRTQRPNQFYPIYVDPDQLVAVTVGEPLLSRDDNGQLEAPSMDEVDGLVPVWPIDENGDERAWAFISPRMAEEIAIGNLTVGRYNERRKTWAMKIRRVKKQETRLKERTVWWDSRYDSGANGTTMLTALLGQAGTFPFPKSLYTMTDLIAVCTVNRPDAVIVDFFAGSGTTMHATAYLNSLDNGRRRSIIVTNNEVTAKLQPILRKQGLKPGDPEWEKLGIFHQATLPRCVAAVTGKRPSGENIPDKYRYKNNQLMSAGLMENVEFYALTYEDPDRVRLGAEFTAVAPLLWLMAGASGPRIEKLSDTWEVPNGGHYGVLFDADAWPGFIDAVRAAEGLTHGFIVTDSDAVFQRVVAELPEEVTPVRLYESYLRSFAINTGARS